MKILGDYHTHTDNSDGTSTVEQIVDAAVAAGLQEVAITDHGHARWFSGIKPKQYSMVKALAEKYGKEKGIKTLFGVEANIIGTAGQLDFNCEEHYKKVDILLCGLHRAAIPANIVSFFTFFVPNWFFSLIRWTPKSVIRHNTEVVKRAFTQHNVDVYVHPNRYTRVDVVEIAKVCAERGILIELNSKKISFRPIDFERMLAVGAKFIVSSDAHSARRVGSTTKVAEFLKLCDWEEKDIVNLGGTFKRKDPKYCGIQIRTSHDAENPVPAGATAKKIEDKEDKDDIHPKRQKRDSGKKRSK